MRNEVFLLALIFAFAFTVSAEIELKEPAAVYNLGDQIPLEVSGIIGSEKGNLNLDLICENYSSNLVRIPARTFELGKEQSYAVPYKIINQEDLELDDLNRILGTCFITAVLGGGFDSTEKFTITKEISTKASVDKLEYNPGEAVNLKIEATKANGNPLEGFVQASNASQFIKEIENGFLEESFEISPTAEAGVYVLNVVAYDLGDNGVLNQGEANLNFLVRQVPTSLVPSISSNEIMPGEKLKIGVDVFDQSGVKMNSLVNLKIVSSDNQEIEKTLSSGEFIDLEFPSNASAGNWKIYSSLEELIEERDFEVAAIQKVELNIEDNVLTVTNVGNAVYDKVIQIKIGEETKDLELKIGVGESRKFSLKAPDGEYDVTVGDGENSVNKHVLLTGRAISVKDLESVGIFKGYSIVWIFLILVLAGLSFVLFKRSQKTKILRVNDNQGLFSKIRGAGGVFTKKVGDSVPVTMKKNFGESVYGTRKSPAVHSLDDNHSHEDKTMLDFTKGKTDKAEATLVMGGEKYPSVVISISVKNFAGLNDITKQELKKLINEKKGLGLVDWRGDYVFIVFSPLVTKTYHNEELATKIAFDLVENLKAYNKKFINKITFNIGVHSGELITSKDKGKLKYTSIGNTISLAKGLSDSESESLVVSDEIRKKMLRDLKVEKGKEIGKYQAYVVKGLKDKVNDEVKLKELLKRVDN